MKKINLTRLVFVAMFLFVLGAVFPVLWKVTTPIAFTIFFVWGFTQMKNDVKEIIKATGKMIKKIPLFRLGPD